MDWWMILWLSLAFLVGMIAGMRLSDVLTARAISRVFGWY